MIPAAAARGDGCEICRSRAPLQQSAMPLFSVVVVHYQGANSHETFVEGIRSLQAQTFRDFEILCYHDGPLLDASVQFPVPVVCTERRFNDWGHSLRDLGIRQATGDYIVHFNADNILYPEALEEIARAIQRPPRLVVRDTPLDTNDIIIFPIRMWGFLEYRRHFVRFKSEDRYKDAPDFYTIFTGLPPRAKNIDCMQLVMKRELWLAEGGWHDKRERGDGEMYEQFTRKYGYRQVGPVLGEHF
jgi:hypothetical protein